MGESHGSHHDHEVAVVGGTAEQVWGHTREMALGEGAGREDVEDKPSLQEEKQGGRDGTEVIKEGGSSVVVLMSQWP